MFNTGFMHSDALSKVGIDHQIRGDPTLFDVLFTAGPCQDHRSAKHQNAAMANRYNAVLRQYGILKLPANIYPSLAFTDADLTQTKAAIDHAVTVVLAMR
jgi:glutamate-1-semialdehyde 2,1-aminomutase